MTCLACANRGHATRTGSMFIRCPVAGTPRLAGQLCAYSEGGIWKHVEAARDRLKLLESLHAWAHAKAEEAAYWDAAVGKPESVSTICKPYTSQRGVFAAELKPVVCGECIDPVTGPCASLRPDGECMARKCDQPNPICPTCTNHDGECVCVGECHLGSRYERRDGND